MTNGMNICILGIIHQRHWQRNICQRRGGRLARVKRPEHLLIHQYHLCALTSERKCNSCAYPHGLFTPVMIATLFFQFVINQLIFPDETYLSRCIILMQFHQLQEAHPH